MAGRDEVRSLHLDLDDRDRRVSDTYELRIARHPSEDEAFFVARVLAWTLLHEHGIELSAGVCVGDEPAIGIRRPDGALRTWIEIGRPAPERLTRAALQAEEVVVVLHRRASELALPRGTSERIAGRVRCLWLDPGLVDALAARVERRMAWKVRREAGVLRVESAGTVHEGTLRESRLTP